MTSPDENQAERRPSRDAHEVARKVEDVRRSPEPMARRSRTTESSSSDGPESGGKTPERRPISGDAERREVDVTAVCWAPNGAAPMDVRRWMLHGAQLGRLGAGANWWIGDWVRYGNSHYGERYARASRLTGYRSQTLMNFAYVATHITADRRDAHVSWSHHAELAALHATDQLLWLERITVDRLSVKDLRAELRAVLGPTAVTITPDPDKPAAICHACGQPLPPPAAPYGRVREVGRRRGAAATTELALARGDRV
jgi:hypothetical protein